MFSYLQINSILYTYYYIIVKNEPSSTKTKSTRIYNYLVMKLFIYTDLPHKYRYYKIIYFYQIFQKWNLK